VAPLGVSPRGIPPSGVGGAFVGEETPRVGSGSAGGLGGSASPLDGAAGQLPSFYFFLFNPNKGNLINAITRARNSKWDETSLVRKRTKRDTQ
jgi:hypothetical protein